MDPRICKYCGNEFVPQSGNAKYCSEKCRRDAQVTESVKKKISKRTAELWGIRSDLPNAFGYKCAICGWGVPNGKYREKVIKQGGCDIHHIIPVSAGGPNTVDNLVLLCKNCHELAHLGLIDVSQLRSKTLTEEDIERIITEKRLAFPIVYLLDDII